MDKTKAQLTQSLEVLNQAVLHKLEGLGEYDLRRPLTPTGSNLLGIVKHLASVQVGYFGATFDRPWPEPLPWFDEEAEINADMFATAAESSEEILNFYRRSWAHAVETIETTGLADTGTVAWWPEERRHPTLHMVLVHMTIETARHAGHIDIIRELIDGRTGRFDGDQSVPGDDELSWPNYFEQVEAEARAASSTMDRRALSGD